MAEDLKEFGSTGLKRTNTRINEEWLKDLQGRRFNKVIKEMQDQDAVIGAILFAIEMLIRQVSWRIEPGGADNSDLEAADFLESCMQDMSHSRESLISEIISFLPWGWSYFELVYKKRSGPNQDKSINSQFFDGRIGWRKIAIRGQDSFSGWKYAEDKSFEGMIQEVIGKPNVLIPIEKSLLFRTTHHKQNPQGRSILRNCYRAWFFKRRIEEFEGIGVERDLAGLPVMWVPNKIMSGEATPTEQAIFALCKDIVQNIRRDEQEGIVMPGSRDPNGNRHYELELLGSPGRRQFNAQPLTSKVLTPDGWKTIGDMEIDQEIVSPLGEKSFVTGVYPKGKREVYKITTADGRSTKADGDHLWVVTDSKLKSKNYVKNYHNILKNYTVVTTNDIDKRNKKRTRLHLPPIKPVRYNDNISGDLIIDPYVLGALIGDGYLPVRNNIRLYSADAQIAHEVETAICLVGDRIKKYNYGDSGKASTYVLSGTLPIKRKKGKGLWSPGIINKGCATKKALIDMGLIGKKSHSKFVPSTYLYSSIEDRISLLQGLMDTDGTIDCNGFISFGTASKQLHLDILNLIRSLGGTCGTHIRENELTMVPRKTGSIPHMMKIYYWIKNIRLPSWINPFRLERKASRLRKFSMEYHNGIKSVEFIGVEEVQCIKVSGNSSMYITDDFIPTHNTGEIINRYDQRIATTVLADFILLGQSKVGSWALADSKTELFSTALRAWLEEIKSVFNRHGIPRLFAFNNFNIEKLPQLAYGDIETPNLKELGDYIKALSGAGAELFPDDTLENHLRSAGNLPQKEEQE